MTRRDLAGLVAASLPVVLGALTECAAAVPRMSLGDGPVAAWVRSSD